MVCVVPGKLPAKVIVAPNSPSARAQHSTAAGQQRGAMAGTVTRRKVVIRSGAERRRRLLEVQVAGPQRPLDGDDQERHRDERLGDDHAGRGERQGDAEPVSRYRPTMPSRPKASSSARPPTTGGSTSGRVTSARSSAHAAEPGAGQHPGERDAEHEGQNRCGRGALERQAQRLQRPGCRAGCCGRPRHGARTSRATSGRNRKSRATAAGTARAIGHRGRRRRRPADRVAPVTGRAKPSWVSTVWPAEDST